MSHCEFLSSQQKHMGKMASSGTGGDVLTPTAVSCFPGLQEPLATWGQLPRHNGEVKCEGKPKKWLPSSISVALHSVPMIQRGDILIYFLLVLLCFQIQNSSNLLKIIVAKYIEHKIYPFKVYNSKTLSLLSVFCNHHHPSFSSFQTETPYPL